MTFGTLYLLPVPLGDEALELALPTQTIELLRRCTVFIAESAKHARAVLKRLEHPTPLQQIQIMECHEHTKTAEIAALLQPLRDGQDVGLMSEAGVPCIADPGQVVVQAAHREKIPVMPRVGPSSIVLALMASGLSGQSFEFVGYLPADQQAREVSIRALEESSRKSRGQTKIFIETPYRSEHMLESLVKVVRPNTVLCVAAELLQQNHLVRTLSGAAWKRLTPEERRSLVRDEKSEAPARCIFLLSGGAT